MRMLCLQVQYNPWNPSPPVGNTLRTIDLYVLLWSFSFVTVLLANAFC